MTAHLLAGVPHGAKVIPLTRGYVAWVDEEDFPALSATKWNAMVHKGIVYAVRHRPGSRGGVIYMHRVLLPGERAIDHVEHPPGVADNRRSNLRGATKAQNVANARKLTAARSVFRGVAGTAGKSPKPWRAYINGGSGHRSLGYFWNEGYAAIVRDLKAVSLHGEYARTNFPVPGSRSWSHG